MNYVPIKVNFSTDVKEINTRFTIDEPTHVRFVISYRHGKKKNKYMGNGYIGERISNERL